MRYRILLFAAMLLAPLGAAAQPLIQSQEGIALQNEILQLQQQVQQLQGQGGNGGSSLGTSAPPSSSTGGAGANNPLIANLLTQVQQLQAQVQSLNGQVSELKHEMDTQNAQTQKQIGDLQFQMTNGGAGGAAAASAGAGAAQAASSKSQVQLPSPPPAATAPKDPKAALKEALDAYNKHDYTTARTLAQSILTTNKQAPEAYRAQYLVAQSYAAQNDPKSAAVAFYSTYNMNKNGTYAPHALLGLASSLTDLHQNQEACETISSLNSQFTNPSPGMKRDIDAVATRAHCQ
jgi:TolA-binding protein